MTHEAEFVEIVRIHRELDNLEEQLAVALANNENVRRYPLATLREWEQQLEELRTAVVLNDQYRDYIDVLLVNLAAIRRQIVDKLSAALGVQLVHHPQGSQTGPHTETGRTGQGTGDPQHPDASHDPNTREGAQDGEGAARNPEEAAAEHAEREAVHEELHVEEEALTELKKEMDHLISELDKDVTYFKNLGKLAYAAVRGEDLLERRLQRYTSALQSVGYPYEINPPMEQRVALIAAIKNDLEFFKKMMQVEHQLEEQRAFFLLRRVINSERVVEQEERNILSTLHQTENILLDLSQRFSSLNHTDPRNPVHIILTLRTELESISEEQLRNLRAVLEAAKEIKNKDDALVQMLNYCLDKLQTLKMKIETKEQISHNPIYVGLQSIPEKVKDIHRVIEAQVMIIRNEREFLEHLETKFKEWKVALEALRHIVEIEEKEFKTYHAKPSQQTTQESRAA